MSKSKCGRCGGPNSSTKFKQCDKCRAYYAAHREQHRVYVRKSYRKHRARARDYQRRNPERLAYASARQRCANPKSEHFQDYGGRGIKFLFESFAQFWAEIGPRPSPKHELDRIDNDGHYEPGNVRWATRSEQNRNRRSREQVLWDRYFAAAHALIGALAPYTEPRPSNTNNSSLEITQ